MIPRPRALLALLAAVVVALSAAACAGGPADPDDTIVLGATLALSGDLGVLGGPLEAGYQQEVADVNRAGGITVGGVRKKVRLIVLDNGSDPTTASQQARELVLKDGAAALLGFTTPPIVMPTALIAEQYRVPFVTSLTPTEAFAAGDPAGWKYSWDFFFDEKQQAAAAARALASVSSDKKAVLFTDNEPDGVLERPLYKAAMKAAGLDVVGDYTFPVGTTDFSSFISDARAKGAQLMAAQMTPADGVTLWKQLKSFDFAPKAAYVAKASDAGYWWQSLGSLAQGSLSEGYWSPSGVPARQLAKVAPTLGKKFGVSGGNMASAVLAYTAAEIVTDAIARSGSTDPGPLDAAIGKTSGEFPGGRIRFSPRTHTAITPYYITQWQNGRQVQVQPPLPGTRFEQPPPGLG